MELLYLSLIYSAAVAIATLLRKRGAMLIALVPCLAVLSNILGSARILSMPFGFSAPAGIIPFMLSFFLLDVINEFFGEKNAREGVTAGLIAVGVSVLLIKIVTLWSSASFMNEESVSAFATVFSLTPRLFFAGLISFGVSSYIDIRIFSVIRKKTGKGFLWLRENVSTIVSVLVSNLIFLPLGYYGTGYPVVNMIVGHTMAQTLIALLDTPFIYMIGYIYENTDVREIRKRLGDASFVAIRNGDVVFESREKGLKPFIDAIGNTDLEGAVIGDKIVGKASALLSCYSKPSMVYTPEVTKEALDLLSARDMKIKYEKVVNMPFCKYDEVVRTIDDPEKAYAAIKERIKNE